MWYGRFNSELHVQRTSEYAMTCPALHAIMKITNFTFTYKVTSYLTQE